MSDTITKWHEMQDENKEVVHADETAKYIFVLDFTDGKVYRYKIGLEVESDKIEDYLIEQGHSPSNIEWMLTKNGKLHTYMDK